MKSELRVKLSENSWKELEALQEFYAITNRSDLVRFLIADKYRQIKNKEARETDESPKIEEVVA